MSAEVPRERVSITESPENAETPLAALAGALTPKTLFFRRNHFAYPTVEPATWRLRVDGLVDRELQLSLEELEVLTESTALITLECAGNGRSAMSPPVAGTPWGFGAVSTGHFSGVRLTEVLDRAGVQRDAVEVLVTGADGYQRSLPLKVACEPRTLLAVRMNGEPLAPEYGFPLRLVVGEWYGMAAAKWIERITLLGEAFKGKFQTEEYVYVGEEGIPDQTPVTTMRVRSLIASLFDGAQLPQEPVEILGSAWSGKGGITQVEVSTDDGASWQVAELEPPTEDGGRTLFRFGWRPMRPGWYTLLSRAVDAAGNQQPLEPVWNRLGYGNNAVYRVRVFVGEEGDEGGVDAE